MTKLVKTLTGHSGCSILLLEDDNEILVRKISSDSKYNKRLKRQCLKQKKFKNSNNVFAPAIKKINKEDELFYFDMEYVQGKILAEYVEDISILDISDYIRCLFQNLYIKNNNTYQNINKIFLGKIIDLQKKLKNKKHLQYAFKILNSFDWSNIQKSPCHGDLTLENIIITKDKKIYLIDFLDSFCNSWMIDIAKLLQDLELKWSFRNKAISSNAELRLLIAKEALIEEILKLDNGVSILKTIYYILLLNIIRIYPYTTDEKTLNYLDTQVAYLTSKVNNNLREVIK